MPEEVLEAIGTSGLSKPRILKLLAKRQGLRSTGGSVYATLLHARVGGVRQLARWVLAHMGAEWCRTAHITWARSVLELVKGMADDDIVVIP